MREEAIQLLIEECKINTLGIDMMASIDYGLSTDLIVHPIANDANTVPGFFKCHQSGSSPCCLLGHGLSPCP
jgi:hypothetical protein